VAINPGSEPKPDEHADHRQSEQQHERQRHDCEQAVEAVEHRSTYFTSSKSPGFHEPSNAGLRAVDAEVRKPAFAGPHEAPTAR